MVLLALQSVDHGKDKTPKAACTVLCKLISSNYCLCHDPVLKCLLGIQYFWLSQRAAVHHILNLYSPPWNAISKHICKQILLVLCCSTVHSFLQLLLLEAWIELRTVIRNNRTLRAVGCCNISGHREGTVRKLQTAGSMPSRPSLPTRHFCWKLDLSLILCRLRLKL